MVTTKRQINTDSDKYCKERNSRVASIAANEAPSDVSSMRNYTENNMTADLATADIFVHPETSVGTRTKNEPQKPALPSRPEKEPVKLNREDIMPSIKTQRAAENVPEEKAVELSAAIPANNARNKMSSRMKVMLFVYVAIALVLAIAVIATGVAISNASAESADLTAKISRQTAELNETASQLSAATDPATLKAKASELGMVDAPEATNTVTLVERTEYPTATPHTNWFDSLSDWLSGVFN